jgi:WD40 repeat protein
LAFSPDGQEIAASGLRPRQWALPSGKLVRTHDPPNNPRGDRFATGTLVYSPDGETIALSFAVLNFGVNRYDSHVFLFDRATGEQVGDLNVAFKYAHPRMLAFSPDGSAIAGNFGPALGVLSVEDGTIVAWIQPGTKHITGLAFTPDGSKLVTVSNDERVRVYDTRAWTETTGYEWQVGKLGCVVVAPDGLRMAAGSGTGKVVVWDVDPG